VKTDALLHRTMQIEDSAQHSSLLITLGYESPITEAESVKRLVARGRGADIVDIEICARTRVECEWSVCFVWMSPIFDGYFWSSLGMPTQFFFYLTLFKFPPVQTLHDQHLRWAPGFISLLVNQGSTILFWWCKHWMCYIWHRYTSTKFASYLHPF